VTEHPSRWRASPLIHVTAFATLPVVLFWAENPREPIGPATVLAPMLAILIIALALFASS
jgi:hypothetical protein